jgi:hypothetical protein
MTPAAPDKHFVDAESVGSEPARLVTVHGIQGTRAAWLPVAAELSTECTVVLPNLRGARSIHLRHISARPCCKGGHFGPPSASAAGTSNGRTMLCSHST